jgi:hypothetical protein
MHIFWKKWPTCWFRASIGDRVGNGDVLMRPHLRSTWLWRAPSRLSIVGVTLLVPRPAKLDDSTSYLHGRQINAGDLLGMRPPCTTLICQLPQVQMSGQVQLLLHYLAALAIYSSSQKGCRGVLDFPSSKLSSDFPPRQKKTPREKHFRRVWSHNACAHKTQVMPNSISWASSEAGLAG